MTTDTSVTIRPIPGLCEDVVGHALSFLNGGALIAVRRASSLINRLAIACLRMIPRPLRARGDEVWTSPSVVEVREAKLQVNDDGSLTRVLTGQVYKRRLFGP